MYIACACMNSMHAYVCECICLITSSIEISAQIKLIVNILIRVESLAVRDVTLNWFNSIICRFATQPPKLWVATPPLPPTPRGVSKWLSKISDTKGSFTFEWIGRLLLVSSYGFAFAAPLICRSNSAVGQWR